MATTQPPKTETKTVSETRQHFSETLNRVYRGETRVLVEKSGIPVGAIVSANDLEELRRMEARTAEQWAAVDRMRAAFADVPEDDFNDELGKAIKEVEEERKQRKLRSENGAS